MNASWRTCLAAIVPMLLVGCVSAPSAPETMREVQTDFNAYKTFGWAQPAATTGSAESASVVDGYIRTAIANELKGTSIDFKRGTWYPKK